MLKYDCTVLHLNKNKLSWEKNKILGFKAKFRSSIYFYFFSIFYVISNPFNHLIYVFNINH